MSVDCGVGELEIISQVYARLHDIPDNLLALTRCDASNQVTQGLELSKERLEKWWWTFQCDASTPIETAIRRCEILLEKDNWVKVLEILDEITRIVGLLKHVVAKPDNAKVGRKLILKIFKFGQLKKPQPPTSLHLALELRQTIEWLWVYSGVSNELMNGSSKKEYSPALDQQLSRCVTVRQGAVVLYEACQRSTRRCELELDIWSDRDMPTNRQHITPLATETSLFYHITVVSATTPEVTGWNLTAQSLEGPEVVAMNPDITVHDEPDLTALEPSPLSSSHILGIRPSYSGINCDPWTDYYFEVTAAHTTAGSMSESERSAPPLKSNRPLTAVGSQRPLTWQDKWDLAYNLAQSGFYLLGTPWLASLSSKTLRIMKTKDRAVFILDVKTWELESIFLDENSYRLSDSWQLFQIGLILIDIALDYPDASDLARLEDPHSYAAMKLPLVYHVMGAYYYRACAFCVKDRRSSRDDTYNYQHHSKYAYPEKTSWKCDLKQLLEEYHIQVVSR